MKYLSSWAWNYVERYYLKKVNEMLSVEIHGKNIIGQDLQV